MPEEKKGELYLEELGSHEWKAFWFVLDEGYLRYFASEGDLEPRAAIPCRGIVAKSVGKSRVGKHAFRLDVTKQEDGRYKYVLAGEEEVDSLEWLEALRDHGCHVNIDKIRLTARPEGGEAGLGRFLSFGQGGKKKGQGAEAGMMNFLSFSKTGKTKADKRSDDSADGMLSFLSFSKAKKPVVAAKKPATLTAKGSRRGSLAKGATFKREASRFDQGDMTMPKSSIAAAIEMGDIDGDTPYAEVLAQKGRASLVKMGSELAEGEAALGASLETALSKRQSSGVVGGAGETPEVSSEELSAGASSDAKAEDAEAEAEEEADEEGEEEDPDSDEGGAVEEYLVEEEEVEVAEAATEADEVAAEVAAEVVAEVEAAPAAPLEAAAEAAAPAKQPSLLERLGSSLKNLVGGEPTPVVQVEVPVAAAPTEAETPASPATEAVKAAKAAAEAAAEAAAAEVAEVAAAAEAEVVQAAAAIPAEATAPAAAEADAAVVVAELPRQPSLLERIGSAIGVLPPVEAPPAVSKQPSAATTETSPTAKRPSLLERIGSAIGVLPTAEAPPAAPPASPPMPAVVDTPAEAQVREWVRAVLMSADDLPGLALLNDRTICLREQLRSGLVLCAVLNALKPRSVGKLKVPSASATRFAKLEPLQTYRHACGAAGLTERDCLSPEEWLDGGSLQPLYEHLSALCRVFPSAPKFVPPGGLRKAPTKGGASRSALGGVVPFATADDVRKKGQHGKVTRTAVATGNSAFRGATSNASAAKAVFEAEKGPTNALGLPSQGLGGPAKLSKAASSQQRTGVQTTVRSNTGATHSFAESETIAFSEFINETLGGDDDVSHLIPIDVDAEDFTLFDVLRDGVILCKLINAAVPETIDERAVHTGALKPLSVFEVVENLNMAINAAGAIGCRVVNIGQDDILQGSPHICLGLLWQIVKVAIMANLNLKASPELMALLGADANDVDAMKALNALAPEKVLLKWLNYQVQRVCPGAKEATNFGSALKDSTLYSHLLSAVAPPGQSHLVANLPMAVSVEKDPIAKAQLIIDAASQLGITQFKVMPADIAKGNEKLNMGFTAAIFNQLPGLSASASEGLFNPALAASHATIKDGGRVVRLEETGCALFGDKMEANTGTHWVELRVLEATEPQVYMGLMPADGDKNGNPGLERGSTALEGTGRGYVSGAHVCNALGMQWTDVGPTKPSMGTELACPALSAALAAGQTSFTPAELDAFGLTNLSHGSYVRAGESYFQPLKSAGVAYGKGDLVKIAFDTDAGVLRYYKNGVLVGWQAAGDAAPFGTHFAVGRGAGAFEVRLEDSSFMSEAARGASKLLEQLGEDESDSREERAFRMWMNSLGLDTHVNNLIDQSADGLLILETMDKIQPGVVDWKRVDKKPKNVHIKTINCNYAVELGKSAAFKFSLVGIDGTDIVKGNTKLILAIVWQMMRYHVIKFLTSMSGSDTMLTEADVLRWANDKVDAQAGLTAVKKLSDAVLSSGVYVLNLIKAVAPRSVDMAQVTAGKTPEDKKLNARLAISCARRAGCMIFALWEDVVEAKPKMLLVMFATLMQLDIKSKADAEAASEIKQSRMSAIGEDEE